jgi:hypothetical protein
MVAPADGVLAAGIQPHFHRGMVFPREAHQGDSFKVATQFVAEGARLNGYRL